MLDTSESICEILDKMYAAGETVQIEDFLMQALLINQPRAGQITSAFITVLYELGVYFRQNGKLSRALDWFLLLRNIVRVYLGKDSFEHAFVIENMALTYERMGEYDKALYYYLKALKIYRQTAGTRCVRYTGLLNSISRLYSAQKDYRAALLFHENLISVRGHTSDNSYVDRINKSKTPQDLPHKTFLN